MGSTFHQLCPRYSGTLTPTAPTAIRLWETFTFLRCCGKNVPWFVIGTGVSAVMRDVNYAIEDFTLS